MVEPILESAFSRFVARIHDKPRPQGVIFAERNRDFVTLHGMLSRCGS
jgi:hypothetical protein